MNLQSMSLHEAIHTQRAVRYFSDAPVPEDVVEAILDAAVRAPSAGNSQPWHFIVIRDRETKRRFGEWYLRSWKQITAAMGDGASSESYRSGGDLARHVNRTADHHSGTRCSSKPLVQVLLRSFWPATSLCAAPAGLSLWGQ